MAQIINIVKTIIPKNSSKNISTKTSIKLTFTESVSKEELLKNVILREVNGNIIEHKQVYEGTIKTLTIQPLSLLPFNKKIEIFIKGGKDGIKTVYENTLINDISNFFTTEEEEEKKAIIPPSEIKIVENNGYISINYNKEKADVTYYKITETNEFTSKNIYPDNNEEINTGIRIQVPHKFKEGMYYLWMKNIYKEESELKESEYILTSFEVNEIDTTIPPMNLSILESYPGENQIIKDFSKFAIKFSDEITNDNLEELITISKEIENDFSNILFNNLLKIKIESNNKGLVIFNLINENDIEKGIKYNINIDKNISNSKNIKLGINKKINFMIYPERFYTSVKSVRIILGQFNDLFTDLDIMELIADVSNSTYSRFENSKTFKKEEWEDGSCPYYVSEYVKFKVVYLLVLNNILKTASGSGKNIKLADLEVGERNMASTELKDLLKFLKDELDKWEDLVEEELKQAKFAKSKASIWAKDNEFKTEYPTHINRLPFKDIGG